MNLKYIDAADLATNKIRLVPKEERETDPGAGTGPDAEDLMVLKRKMVLSSPKNAVGGRASRSRGQKVSQRLENIYKELFSSLSKHEYNIQQRTTCIDLICLLF